MSPNNEKSSDLSSPPKDEWRSRVRPKMIWQPHREEIPIEIEADGVDWEKTGPIPLMKPLVGLP